MKWHTWKPKHPTRFGVSCRLRHGVIPGSLVLSLRWRMVRVLW